MSTNKLLGLKIKNLRSSKSLELGIKITQSKLASELGISRSYLGDIESGRTKPSDEILNKFVTYFNVTLEYLLSEEPAEGNTLKEDIYAKIPEEYSSKYKVTSRDVTRYMEEMKKSNEAFFLNDELNEDDKKEMLDLMSELFWKAKSINKEKRKKNK